MQNASGLRHGQPVWLLGIEIGSVESIQLDDQVRVHISIKKHYLKFIHEGAEGNVVSMGLLGDRYMELSTGFTTSPSLKSGAVIAGTVKPGFQEIIEASAGSVQQANVLIVHLDSLISEVTEGKGVVAKVLQDTLFYRHLVAISGSVHSILSNIEHSHGTLQKFISDSTLYDELRLSAASITSTGRQLSAVLDTINHGHGAARALVNDQALALELKKTIEAMEALIADVKLNPKKYLKISIF